MLLLYIVLCTVVFLMLMRLVGQRWGEHLYKDPVTWILCAAVASSIVTGAAVGLALITGHLSGRL